ncbi:hypothetical protein LTR84_003196 [Exophiala bonariae]|uniref:Uncharacterized protein n=1 Tax=Exophiala bonariae TaxID=1690606 RepID=A0AAV9NBV2_9EURO|nr:hypothetical protein LTR84_003196 [Exophiala bonariae]
MTPSIPNTAVSDRFSNESCSTPESRAHFAKLPDPKSGYQPYDNKLPISSHSPQGRLSIQFELSGTKCSISGQNAFRLALSVENGTNLPLAFAVGRQPMLISEAYSRGPELIISQADDREIVATYRFEVCSVPEVPRIIKQSGLYDGEDFDHLRPGVTEPITVDLNSQSVLKEEFCDDLMEKLAVGRKYRISIRGSRWESGKTAPVRCQACRRGPDVFEVVY